MPQSKLEKILEELKRRSDIRSLQSKWSEHRNPTINPTQDDPWSYIPQKPTVPQETFLNLTCKEALYGGAAGSGKSSALLMNSLLWVHIPKYSGLILRKSFTDLTMPGGLIDRAHDWLQGSPAHFIAGKMCWVFPSGARLFFGHLADDGALDKYQGAHFHYIGFDELTQHPERRYTYLLSRNRRHAHESEMLPEIMRATTNPGGIGHEWVYARFVKPLYDGHVTAEKYTYKDCVFVPAKVDDNPYLDIEAYKKSLERMDDLTMRQLLHGDWEVRPSDLMFNVSEDQLLPDTLSDDFEGGLRKVLAIDLGSREDQPTTAFAVMGWSDRIPNKVWILNASKFAGLTTNDIGDLAYELISAYDGIEKIVADQGGLGELIIKDIRQRFGLPVTGVKKKDRLAATKIFISAIKERDVYIVAPDCEALLDEFKVLRWNETGTDCIKGQPDHAADAARYAYREALAFLSEVPEPKVNPHLDLKRWQIEQEEQESQDTERRDNQPIEEIEDYSNYL